jgi:parallel beta-helix repeat protein
MKIILTIFIFWVTFSFIHIADAANYYISNNKGDDSRTVKEAQNPQTPWKTINNLNANIGLLLPGDSVLFARGESFNGTLNVTISGSTGLPIVFSAYGTGDLPVISGMETLSGWVEKEDNIWESTCKDCGDTVNVLTLNDQPETLGRYPNANAPNKGYLTFESHAGNTQISDSSFNSSTDWTGAEIVIRSNNWIIDRSKITNQTGGQFTFSPSITYEPTNYFGYFIQNHIGTLDLEGEWCYTSTDKSIDIFHGLATPLINVEVSVLNNLVTIYDNSHLEFDNIRFKGANENIFDLSNSQYVTINQCELLDGNITAINGTNTENLTITNNSILNSNNNAIYLQGICSNSIIKNNILKNTGMNPGMGQSGDGNYFALRITGNKNDIELNSIDSTGYMPIYFQGDSTIIKNNFIKDYTLVKDDGGGIYTWNGSGNISPTGSKIFQNIVLNGTGAPEGTNLNTGSSHGIYLDDNTSNVEVSNNTIANTSEAGIYLHNTKDIIFKDNTLYNNNYQLEMSHNEATCKNCTMQNNKVIKNIFFAKKPTQLISNLDSYTNDISSFGVMDSNYYCRPIDFNNVIYTSNGQEGENAYDLQGWQNGFHQDSNSKTAPFPIQNYTINKITGVDLFANNDFDSDISGVSCISKTGICNTGWDNSGKLDGGSLKVSISSVPNIENYATIVFGIGAVSSTKNYVLKFSIFGTKKDKTVRTYLQQTNSPQSLLTPVSFCPLNNGRNENEVLFNPFTATNASLCIDFDQNDSILWLDNIELFEADISATNLDETIRFEYNATSSTKPILLTDTLYDVKNNRYSGQLNLQPYSSVILMKNPQNVIFNTTLAKMNAIIFYPNPVNDIIDIILPNNHDRSLTYQIYDISGRLCLIGNSSINNSESEFHLEIDTLKHGMYILKVNSNQTSYMGKFIKT